MQSFHVTGSEGAVITGDRTRFGFGFRTDKGPITLEISAEHLDEFITFLQGIESRATLFNPATGPVPGEKGPVRALIVEGFQIQSGKAKDVPSVLLGLKAAKVFRWYALNKRAATALQQGIADKLPELQGGQEGH